MFYLNIAPKVPLIARYIWLAVMVLSTIFSMSWGATYQQKLLLGWITFGYFGIVAISHLLKKYKNIENGFISFVIDLLVWSVFIYCSGGASNPLITIFLTVVGAATIILNTRQSVYLSLLAILCYWFLWYFHMPLMQQHPHDSMAMSSSMTDKMSNSMSNSVSNAMASSMAMDKVHLLGMFGVFIVALLMMTSLTIYFKLAMNRTFSALELAQQAIHKQRQLLAVSSLAANVAHEMSTPIASIQLLTDDIAAQLEADDELQEDISILKSQITVCRQSLERLKNQIQSNQHLHTQNQYSNTAFERNVTQIDTLLPKVVNEWRFLNPYTQVEIADLPTPLLADINEEQLYSILINILNNAMQAGATQINMQVNVGQMVSIVVEDNGRGIDKKTIDSINHNASIQSSHGWGLGLILAKTILQHLGGNLLISAINDDNKTLGTRVTLQLIAYQQAN